MPAFLPRKTTPKKYTKIRLAIQDEQNENMNFRKIVIFTCHPPFNLTALAKRVEAAHFPDPTASRDPPTPSGESVTDVSNTQFTVVSTLVQ